MTNPSVSILIFFILTLAYSIFKYYSKSPSSMKIWTLIYFLILIITQFFINLGLTNEICGFKQYNVAFTTTIIPWVFIFGSIFLILKVFPNWLEPFSNTFGYFFTYITGVNGFFKSILKDKNTVKLSSNQSEMINALNNVYEDKSLLINSMTITNLPFWWESMKKGGILKPTVGQKEFDTLLGYIKLKTNVSEFIWYALTGLMASSVSYNYIINTGCVQSVEEMEKRHDEYLEQEQNLSKAKQEKQEQQITYKSYE